MVVSGLFDRVRSAIGDTQKTKYTDDRLLDLANEGMTDIVKETNIFRASTDILVENGVTRYQLPEDVYFLTRVSQNNDPITLYSYDEMDKRFGIWEDDVVEDTIEAIVYDQQNMNEITIYPELNGIGNTYFKLPDGTSVNVNEGTEGAITYLEGTSTDHTIVIDREDENYGALVGISYDWFPLTIQYVKKPTVLLTRDDTLELDDIHLAVLKYYIAGTILFDDDRLENNQKGSAFLGKYKQLIVEMKSNSMRNFHRVNRSTSYRTPFN